MADRVLDPLSTAAKKLIGRGRERGHATHAEVDDLWAAGTTTEIVEDAVAGLDGVGIDIVQEGDGDEAAPSPPE